jgi:NAD(P)-dependent dehydrogenase (short-subunit alcohol dehydrogenase family)
MTDATPRTSTDARFDLRGRVVVLTGASGLIGRALLAAFRRGGARVAAVDLKTPDAATAASDVAGGTGEAVGFEADVTRSEQVAELARRVLEKFGRVDVLVNSHHYKPAGFLEAEAETFPDELWDRILEVQLKATFLTCREFGRAMLRQGRGSIVNLASVYGVVSSNPDLYEGNSLGNPVAYSAAKGGVIMLTRYLGVHWASRGVRVNCVTPAGVFNGQEPAFLERFARKSPMGRMMNVDEVVGAVLYLASDASSYTTGSNLIVDGGWTAW